MKAAPKHDLDNVRERPGVEQTERLLEGRGEQRVRVHPHRLVRPRHAVRQPPEGVEGELSCGAVPHGLGGRSDRLEGGLEAREARERFAHEPLLDGQLGLVGKGKVGAGRQRVVHPVGGGLEDLEDLALEVVLPAAHPGADAFPGEPAAHDHDALRRAGEPPPTGHEFFDGQREVHRL